MEKRLSGTFAAKHSGQAAGGWTSSPPLDGVAARLAL
jgi:hypothetical protein